MNQALPENPREIADLAIEYEKEGRRLLLSARDDACDPLTKATFHFLADQESQHIHAIESYLDALIHKGAFDPSEYEPLTLQGAGREVTKLFEDFRQKYEETACTEEERLKVYQAAMEMERRGYELYSSAASKVNDETSRQFYEFLASEEDRHFQILQDTYTFLKQPDAVMAIEERWMQI